ncbi:hypothetical protein HCJ07_12065 [Listeria booriae]|uniref:hypothetical protein n=1 Tax=Listeria booriae TaxID=1552123 RepID=UPI00162AE4DD|nr:hypothetical protein [Listeria booriae]MBC1531084.1 hypothetical protein [Listeria booriae]
MDVNYDKDVWEKKRQAVGGLLSYGFLGAGTDLVEYLGQVDNLLTEMENDINTLDVDNALYFSFESNKNAYTELRSDYDILYKYTGEVNTVVERAIDDPFYKKMDAFVEGMEKANIENYKTSANLGFGDWEKFNGTYSESVFTDVTINDIYNGDNPFADQMYEAYRIYAIAHNESKQYACTADELLSREAFQKGMLNMYGFDYRSINDGAEESELIRDIVATIAIIGVSVAAGIMFTPAAGFAVFAGLGAAYSSLDVGAAITGQDISGRNLEDGERFSRLFFAVAGVVPFGRAGGLAEDGLSLAGRLGDDAIEATARTASPKVPSVPVIGSKTDKLPHQGNVDGGVPGAPPVNAGDQGKHVTTHNNSTPDIKTQWPDGENGVALTQKAWLEGTPIKPDGSVRKWTDGKITIRVHINKKGEIHGYPESN